MIALLTVAVTMAAIPVESLAEGQHSHAAVASGGYGFQLFLPRDAAARPVSARPRWPLTIYPDTGHWSWVPAYLDRTLTLWMLEQRRQHPLDKDVK